MGVIPTAVSWLFKAIKERRHGAGAARVSVRVSAAEIRTGAGGAEEMRDLLGDSGQCSSHLLDFDIDTGCYQDVDVKIELL